MEVAKVIVRIIMLKDRIMMLEIVRIIMLETVRIIMDDNVYINNHTDAVRR